MKKIFIPLFLIAFQTTVLNAQTPCESVTAELTAPNPQTGQFNYWGVRVRLSHPHSQNITVNGLIFKEGRQYIDGWTLTIPAGSLTAETPDYFYQTDAASSAEVEITSVSECPTNQDPLIVEFINSIEFTGIVQNFINQNYPGLSADMSKSTLSRMQNVNQTPVITIPFVDNAGLIKVSVEATKLMNQNIRTPNNSPYLMMLRDFTSYNSATQSGTIRLYDLSYDGYKFAEANIAEGTVINNTFFEMPQETINRYQQVIAANSTYVNDLTPGQAQCDYNHNNNISYGECYKCFNSACSGSPDCYVMCYLFGDVIGWVLGPAHMPHCQVSIGIACIYIAIAY